MPRIKVAGIPIGCPVVHHESECPRCGGGWPGTAAPSEKLIAAASKDQLDPEKLGCFLLVQQANFLVNYFQNIPEMPVDLQGN